MAARMLFTLDPETGALHLHPFSSEPRGRGEQTPSQTISSSGSAASSSFLGSHCSSRRLPSCAASPAGPCTLRFTFADLGSMQTPMNSVNFLNCTRRGHPRKLPHQQKYWTWYFWSKPNVNNLHHYWLMCYGGCRHK
ncbi:X protein [Musk shrew hepatitis B virus]|uniref:Protein X n=1 Tax=Musk shrew hepatitis B virus TaxID=2596880 RepID=A0A516RTP8_9HEPA|nr:X protein [Musk shrew hepatitis B virus]QDQ19233.1 X protein [Musk shrew hepatitis B virus]